ncbi:MAG: hypothetical protein M1825_004958 [Sarcosagium campestre]|nr:MAG: hypothetical protein M1825_004958 [Sarcosagium campestre]
MLSILTFTLVYCAFLFANLSLASPLELYQRYTVLESLPSTPDGWEQSGRLQSNLTHRFRISLKPADPTSFERNLVHISTPGNAKYGKFMKREDVRAAMRPIEDATRHVQEWLSAYGISGDSIRDDGEWISVVASIATVESLLRTTFHSYRSDADGREILRTLEYSIPGSLIQYINTIQPTTRFGPASIRESSSSSELKLQRREITTTSSSAGPSTTLSAYPACKSATGITSDCIKQLYSFDSTNRTNGSITKLGMTAFREEIPSSDDVQTYLKQYAPSAAAANANYTLTMTQAEGSTAKTHPEGNGPLQISLGLASPVDMHVYYTPGRGELIPDLSHPPSANNNEPFLDLLTYLNDLPNADLPHTLFLTQGEPEHTVPRAYALATCTMFGTLAARGVSVLAASGDDGPGYACQTNEVDAADRKTRFTPAFPQSCPWVTAVGGTTGFGDDEEAWLGSGGGFSDYFERPAWQDSAVQGFLGQFGEDRFAGLYNRSGRAYPDVAAQAKDILIINNSKRYLLSGTTAASPIFASAIATLNQDRISAGLPPLGYLNPFLYSNGTAGLRDIVSGGSIGCAGAYPGVERVPYAGFNATVGWDPVTGLGTPNVTALRALVLNNT